MNDEKIDLACVTEHWLSNEIIERVNIQNYRLVSSFCRIESYYGGAAIFVRKRLLCNELQHIQSFGIEKTIEIAAIRLPTLRLIMITLRREISQFSRLCLLKC